MQNLLTEIRRLINFLKKSKILEKQLDNILNTKLNLETQIASLAQTISNSETIEAIRAGRDVLLASEKKLDPDKVSEMMDDIEETLAGVNEVSELISRPIGQSEDGEALLAEFEAELLGDALSEPTIPVPVFSAPSVPSSSIKETKENKEEKELKELEKIMS